jgi:hypothetical protein
MLVAKQFLKFARGTVWSCRALAGWVRRTGPKGISPVKAEVRRKKLDAKARVILQVADLIPELLSAQEELSQAIAKRRSELLASQKKLSSSIAKKRCAQTGEFFLTDLCQMGIGRYELRSDFWASFFLSGFKLIES